MYQNNYRDAAMAPMREFYHRNKMESADTTSNHSFDIDLDKAPDLTIRMEHFDAAIQNIMPSVSREKLDQYANWMKDYGSK
jgi:SpoVK/Ycf46/Vps4 family AAA+-type ATPase